MVIKIIWGVPGAGKTYYAVRKMLKAMRKRRKKYFFSNFPIYDRKLGWSLVWKPEYARQIIVDAEIVIDEAYRDYNSRNSTNKKGPDVFTKDEHTFFATCRHLNNDIWLIAHNPARIDITIREITEEFLLMHCHKIPILGIPIWFSCDVFLDEQALAQRYTAKHAIYCVERFLFSRRVGKAYDTHFFRPPDIPEFEFESWGEKLGMEKPDVPPGLLTRICSWINRVILKKSSDSPETPHENISREIIPESIPEQPGNKNIEEDLLT